MLRLNNEADTGGVLLLLAEQPLFVRGKDRQYLNGIFGNTKQTYIKFPLKYHQMRRRLYAAGEDGQRGESRAMERGEEKGRRGGGTEEGLLTNLKIKRRVGK